MTDHWMGESRRRHYHRSNWRAIGASECSHASRTSSTRTALLTLVRRNPRVRMPSGGKCSHSNVSGSHDGMVHCFTRTLVRAGDGARSSNSICASTTPDCVRLGGRSIMPCSYCQRRPSFCYLKGCSQLTKDSAGRNWQKLTTLFSVVIDRSWINVGAAVGADAKGVSSSRKGWRRVMGKQSSQDRFLGPQLAQVAGVRK